MDWKRALKPRTVENVVAQTVVSFVFFGGYIIVDRIRERREDKWRDHFRQDKKYS